MKNPTYHHMGDHSESLEVEWDPQKTKYETLLDIFWSSHNPSYKICRQYMSGVWYHNKEQQELINKSLEKWTLKYRTITTEIGPAGLFTPAEDYHQKYKLGADVTLMRALNLEEKDLAYSLPATRINGYLGGNGTVESLETELPSFNLDDDAAAHLREIVARKSDIRGVCRMMKK